jgi:hypothetical protein
MEEKRLKDINQILKYYSEPDIPTKIVKEIQKKFPEVKNYKLLKAEQLDVGINVSLIPLDMSKLLIPARISKIFYRKNNSIESILLYNTYLKIFWRSNPKNYYIFKILSEKEMMINDFFKDYKKQFIKQLKNK